MIYIRERKRISKKVIYTIIFSIVFLVGYVVASVLVMRIARDACFEVMDDSARDQVLSVRNRVEEGKEKLEVAAKMISRHGYLTEDIAQTCIDAFEKTGMLSSVSVMLPTGVVIHDDKGIMYEVSDYNNELLKVPYISDVKYTNDGERYSYWAVPISDGSNVFGILYGIMDLSSFSQVYSVSAYDSNASLYVIDGSSKKLILSTVSEDVVYESSDIGIDLTNEDLAMGKSGSMEYYSSISNETYYAHFKPLGIKNWLVVLTMPKRVAYERANRIQNILWYLSLLEVACVFVYLLWIMRRVRKESGIQQQQFEQLEYMFDVQQILFDAHKRPTLIIRALESVAKMLTAESAFLASTDGVIVKELYYWREGEEGSTEDIKTINISKKIPDISSLLVKGKSFLYYYPDKTLIVDKVDKAVMKEHNVKSIMIVPALDSSDRLVGLIGVANIAQRWDDTILLECIVRNFMMALTNLKSYRLVKKMGTEDSLTGLLNRNSYQLNLREYSYSKSMDICCIYMDANGLHELNNTYGHKAGDDMLRHIGKNLISIFGIHNSYRIGGDEFVVLCKNFDKEHINQKLYLFMKEMMEFDYHISVGLAWRDQHSSMEETVAEAERKMYEDKRTFYKNLGDTNTARI